MTQGLADFSIFTEPQQGASYDELLSVARRCEQLGFGAFFRSDHYLVMGDNDGMPGPTDAWITLAGLARDTSTIRLGTLVSSATFRLPGPFAVSVAQVDQMSGGRIELGLGAGWYQAEHDAYGIPFPDLGGRFDRLEEQYAILDGMWNTPEGETFDFEGAVYQVRGCPALTKPLQSPFPIIVGGGGPRRTPALAARHATEFNRSAPNLGDYPGECDRVRDACRAIDRDPDELTYSVWLATVVGQDDAEFEQRAAAIGREPDELRANGLAGRPDEVRVKLEQWREAGAERVHCQVLDLSDLDHLDLIAATVA